MRLCISYIYWMLLFTSVVSSALLFLIVASENIHKNGKFIGPDRNQVHTEDENITFSEKQLELDIDSKSNIKISSSLKHKLKESTYQNVEAPISASFDHSHKSEESKIEAESEILKESLTQQPNLSQGISEGKQAVVLTLVDTAATLQSLATGHTDFRPRSSESNSSTISSIDEDDQSDEFVHHLSKYLERNDSLVNETESADFQDDVPDVVVVVRAEQKKPLSITESLEYEKPSEPSVDPYEREELEVELTSQQELPKNPTMAPDLNDSAARARLTGNADDSAAAMLDTFVTAGPSDPHEDIPSFNEWAQKRLEEAEKKKSHPNASVQTANGSPTRSVGNMRMRSKNYASPDCGAKIVAANPESQSARNVLVSTRDEYMLNTCTSRVWFVVELCEAIQAKKIELANFELFSSSPKDLSVYVSDRFPTRDWSIVGQFTARDERDIQSFSLKPHLFGKFIKVELHSHYGSEHFCPISLFRVYGTSEFEVLETETESDAHADSRRREITAGGNIVAGSDVENENHDDEDSMFEDDEEGTNDPPGNLFGSARDAVLSIVKKAAEVLVKSDDLKSRNNHTDVKKNVKNNVTDSQLIGCITPVYNIICKDCDEKQVTRVFQLISCRTHYFESLLTIDFFYDTMVMSHTCDNYVGFDIFCNMQDCSSRDDDYGTSSHYPQAKLLTSLFTTDYLIALCNILAMREQRLLANVNRQEVKGVDNTSNETRVVINNIITVPTKDERVVPTGSIESQTLDNNKVKTEEPVIKSKLDVVTETKTLTQNLATQIKPTKTTTTSEELRKQSLITNLETSRVYQTDDVNRHQVETSKTTETQASVGSKRASSSSQKSSSSGAQDQTKSQETVSQGEAPPSGTISKVVQSSENSQKLNEKSISVNGSDVETKIEEDFESKPKAKSEYTEQEIVKEQLNFEGFDFKDIDLESLQSNGIGKSDVPVTQQTASAGTPQQKESVFLRLSNRIKALERNMSLSSQYLEELSRRYKKQVEEMQRSLERAITAMNEETRKGEERENRRLEEVSNLRNQIEALTKILEELVYERNSWRISFSSLMQHAVFVFIDVILVILILSYCRRSDDESDYFEEEDDERTVVLKPKRGTTYEIVKQNCSQLLKKPKKRRPSEIASQVSGTYDQLMIADTTTMNQLSKRDKRKKRKKDSVILRTSSVKESTSKNSFNSQESTRESKLPLRSASASDALYTMNTSGFANLQEQRHDRAESASDNSITYLTNQQPQQLQYNKKVQIIAMNMDQDRGLRNDEDLHSIEDLNISLSLLNDPSKQDNNKSINVKPKKLSSPSFMKTALGSRSKRISFSGGSKKQTQNLDSAMKSSEERYDTKLDSFSELESNNSINVEGGNGHSTNGHIEESDESRSSSATPTSGWNKKEKKSNGLKRMVRKFF